MTGQNHKRREPGAVCRLCGASLEDRHWKTRYCSPTHKAEAHRLAAILRGESTGADGRNYPSAAQRLRADVVAGSALAALLDAAGLEHRRDDGDAGA